MVRDEYSSCSVQLSFNRMLTSAEVQVAPTIQLDFFLLKLKLRIEVQDVHSVFQLQFVMETAGTRFHMHIRLGDKTIIITM